MSTDTPSAPEQWESVARDLLHDQLECRRIQLDEELSALFVKLKKGEPITRKQVSRTGVALDMVRETIDERAARIAEGERQ